VLKEGWRSQNKFADFLKLARSVML